MPFDYRTIQDAVERSLQIIHNIATDKPGALCALKGFRPLSIALNTRRYDGAREKVDMAATVLQEVGVSRHGGKCVCGLLCSGE